jgi:hypothetical protein
LWLCCAFRLLISLPTEWLEMFSSMSKFCCILPCFFFSTGFYSPYRTLAFLNGVLDPQTFDRTPWMGNQSMQGLYWNTGQHNTETLRHTSMHWAGLYCHVIDISCYQHFIHVKLSV